MLFTESFVGARTVQVPARTTAIGSPMDQYLPSPGSRLISKDLSGESPTADEAQTVRISPEGELASNSAAEIPRLRCVGPYVVEQVLSHGGMGVVYKAYDTRLKRPVAIKMILPDSRADSAAVARFRSEAEAVALLQHPNIVQIYEVGEHEGKPFLALEFVDGPNLQHLVAERPFSSREAASLVLTLCEAIDFAHHRGIVHCDLKPGNILMESRRVPKLTDFGLARLRDAHTWHVRPGEVLGTPNYMAPEQAEGDPKGIGPAADIYALGAILYELLTGQPPFYGTPPVETLLRVRLGRLIPPRNMNRKISRDLEAICLKCLEKEPASRYATAHDLADDLRRFLQRRPVAARVVSQPERLWKWVTRNPIVATLTAMLLVFSVAFQIVVFMQWRKQEQIALELERQRQQLQRAQADLDAQRSAARQSRLAAEQSRLRAEWALYRSHLSEAEREFSTYSAVKARNVLERCPVDLRAWEWHRLRRCLEGTSLTHSFSPGHIATFDLAPRSDEYLLVHVDGRVERFDSTLGRSRSSFQLSWPAGSQFNHLWSRARIFASCQWLVAGVLSHRRDSGMAEYHLAVWDLAQNKLQHSWPVNDGFLLDFALSPDGRSLAALSGHWQDHRQSQAHVGGGIYCYDLLSGELAWKRLLDRHEESFHSIQFLPDDGDVVATRDLNDIWLLDRSTGAIRSQRKLPQGTDRMLCVHPSLGWMGLREAHNFQLYDVDGTNRASFIGHTGIVTCAGFSSDGQILVTGASDQTVRVWDVASRRCLHVLAGHSSTIQEITVSADHRLVGSSAGDGSFKVWDLDSTDLIKLDVETKREWTPSVAFGPDGSWLVSASGHGQLVVWDVAARQRQATYRCGLSLMSMSLSPDGKLLAVATRFPNQVTILDRATGATRAEWKPSQKVETVTFSPDGQHILVTGENGLAVLVHWTSGEIVAECHEHIGSVPAASHHPRRRMIATGDDTGTVHLWGMDRFPLQSIKAHDAPVSCTAFSPDGQYLATGVRNRERANVPAVIRIWNVATGELVRELRGHDQSVWCIAWHPSGKRIASGSEDKSIRIWEPFQGEALLTLKGPTDDVRCVCFSPDGRLLAASSDDPFVRVWDATPVDETKNSE